ncbi:MAG: nuclear transport factor 2 family protein [Deltaproteobacteria bacterium]|nr:nuclear transport factor 2 family protein [Deltaproteobacteria bacterium]
MDKLQELYDLEMIKQLKAKYCYYVDEYWADPSNFDRLMAEVFLDDEKLDFDFGPFGHFRGRKEVEGFYRAVVLDILSFSQHLIHSPLIRLANETEATGRWHFLVPCTFRNTGEATWLSGTYHEEYEKRGGNWYIRKIRVAWLFSTPHLEGWVRKNLLAPRPE